MPGLGRLRGGTIHGFRQAPAALQQQEENVGRKQPTCPPCDTQPDLHARTRLLAPARLQPVFPVQRRAVPFVPDVSDDVRNRDAVRGGHKAAVDDRTERLSDVAAIRVGTHTQGPGVSHFTRDKPRCRLVPARRTHDV